MRAHAKLIHVCLAHKDAAALTELTDDGGLDGTLIVAEEGRGACCRRAVDSDVVLYSEGKARFGGRGGRFCWELGVGQEKTRRQGKALPL